VNPGRFDHERRPLRGVRCRRKPATAPWRGNGAAAWFRDGDGDDTARRPAAGHRTDTVSPHADRAGGFRMSVAMSNCGRLGWLSDEAAYRYDRIDPQSVCPWPPLPQSFLRLARTAAADAGFPGREPDTCLINRYRSGEPAVPAPGPERARFRRADRCRITWSAGGLSARRHAAVGADDSGRPEARRRTGPGWPDRLRYHGVRLLKAGDHRLLGGQCIKLSFRQAA